MEKTPTKPWDPAEHLETEEDMAAYLSAALEDGDLSLIMATLGDIARAQRMAVVAQETGLGRESLYKSLSANGNPEFATVLKVVSALGLRLQATATPGETNDFWTAIQRMTPLMDDLKGSKERNWEDYSLAPQNGVYVFYENSDPIYVGRSNNIRNRIRDHGADSSDRNSATFAFKLLRQALNEPKGKAEDIETAHREEYRQQRERIRAMTFRAVSITDQLEQTLFEIYAIIEMGTAPKSNDFQTH